MTVREVITLARTGELLQLSPAIKDNDEVIVGFINLGLIELYKRFQLKTDEALLYLKDGKTVYKLDGTDTDTVIFAGVEIPCVDMGTGAFNYLISAYGKGVSLDNLVFDAKPLPINVEDDPFSVNTIGYNEVQLPLITEGSVVSIIYAAKPNKATVAGLDNEIDIPEAFVEALLNYIGYRAHGSMDGNIQTESNTHYMRFEASCNKVRELGVGIAPDDLEMRDRLAQKGFV